MLSMQYKITLPSDYDMNIIKERTLTNGFKTDGFDGLNFKCYLITEKGLNGNMQNSYCPLYLWNDISGMNKFIFDGFYDNILKSFGWQKIETNVPFKINIHDNIQQMKYAIENIQEIKASESVSNFEINIKNMFNTQSDDNYIIIYNPSNWTVTYYLFTDTLPESTTGGKIYNILHVSK